MTEFSLFELSYLQYLGAKGTEINDILSSFKTTMILFFKILNDELKADPSKAALSLDGTVHEVASKTFNTCRRLLDYSVIIDQFLTEGWVRSILL